jgi:hypothetical protein
MHNFIGKDGFNWWVGVVEDRMDPLKMGRCRVRIFGHHTENKKLLPTADLPWAQAILPTNASKSFAPPKEGEFVTGYFFDGESAQTPVMTGVIPGLKASAGGDAGFQDPRTPEQINAAPKPPAGIVLESVGQPTVPPLARGVVKDTAISQANDNLAHVCDFVGEMQKNINLKKYTKAIAQQIRKAIRAVLRLLGLGDATGQTSWLLNTLKSIKREIDYINKQILQPILDFQKYVLAYIAKLREILQWILSLPRKFLALLQDCLAKIIKAIANVFKDIGAGLSDGLSEGPSNFDEVLKEAKALATSVGDTVKLTAAVGASTIAVVGSATAGLLIPASQAELDAANATIAAYETPVNPPIQNTSSP